MSKLKDLFPDGIQEGDYKVGDIVKILWKDSTGYEEVGEIIKLNQRATHMSVTIKLKDGRTCSVGLKSSLKKIIMPEKVVFT